MTNKETIQKKLLLWDNGEALLPPLAFVPLQHLDEKQTLQLLKAFDIWYGNTNEDVEEWAVEYQLLSRMLLHEQALLCNPTHLLVQEVATKISEILSHPDDRETFFIAMNLSSIDIIQCWIDNRHAQ